MVSKLLINVLDANRERIDILDMAESVLWTKQYKDFNGGCVVTLTPTEDLMQMFLNEAKYLSRDDDDMICEIVKLGLKFDNETNTNTLTITALNAINILNQRIVWEQFNYTDTVEMYIRYLILNNVINPTDPDRKIDIITLGALQNYTERITKQVTYTNILDVIKELCNTYNYGFKLVMLSNKNLAFQLYKGLDCSQNQSENGYIMFSKDYNNLQSLDWEINHSNFKNVCLVAGEGEGTARKKRVVGSAKGINRYEMYSDAKSLSSEDGAITDYEEVLQESGEEALANRTVSQTFTCAIDIEQYEYKVDFDLGYKVTIEADYGLTFDATIVEITECEDSSPYRITANLEI